MAKNRNAPSCCTSPLLSNWGETLIARDLKQRKFVEFSQSDRRGLTALESFAGVPCKNMGCKDAFLLSWLQADPCQTPRHSLFSIMLNVAILHEPIVATQLAGFVLLLGAVVFNLKD